jgi:hypothetical protein
MKIVVRSEIFEVPTPDDALFKEVAYLHMDVTGGAVVMNDGTIWNLRGERIAKVTLPKPFPQESYERDYNCDCDKKIVFDLGSDWGSTTEFFLDKGARLVVAIESNHEYCELFKKYLKQDLEVGKAVLRELLVNHETMGVYKAMLYEYLPDIVKMDIEGYERYIPDIDDYSFSIPKYYMVECHSKEVQDMWMAKCDETGFKLVNKFLNALCTGSEPEPGLVYILHFQRELRRFGQ